MNSKFYYNKKKQIVKKNYNRATIYHSRLTINDSIETNLVSGWLYTF